MATTRSQRSQKVGQNPADRVNSLLTEILSESIRIGASDIHLEPTEEGMQVRVRVDGILKVYKTLAQNITGTLVSRIKVLSRLDITERRMPQDGRLHTKVNGSEYDLRVSTAPMVDGEKVVMRLSNSTMHRMKVDDAGFTPHNLQLYKSFITAPNGLALHVGPTGSGKTTALYIAINHINDATRNIQTIEDPVEVRMDGINQAQVNHDIGLDFAKILRAYLRQDCDVILLGEIRDGETANLAIQAALTGHLVLGTLHANTAVGAVFRITELGVAAFFVGTALQGVVSQRLARRLCKSCRKRFTPPQKVVRAMGLKAGQTIYKAGGCPACNRSGYKGRMVLQEVLKVTDPVRDAIFSGMASHDVEKLAVKEGLVPMFQDGLAKASAGLTSVEEVARIVKGVNVGK